ncbi:MAG: hypothetical protein ABSC25_16940, partial [Roseiarcus sp.]
TKIKRVRFRHPYWPPSSMDLESDLIAEGNPADSVSGDHALNVLSACNTLGACLRTCRWSVMPTSLTDLTGRSPRV